MSANRLSPEQQQVLRLVKCCGDAEGISLRDLMRRLSGMSYTVMLDAVEFLSTGRLIFPTVDEYHYKWTDAINDYIMSPDAINVLRVIKTCRAVEGISLQGLEERLGDMSLPVIWEAVEFLSNEGYIYSTIDQFHYTTTDTINKVLGLIMYFQDSEGICLLDLKRYSRMSLPVIRQAVESLVDDGLVFSPIDGYHYKVTKAINKVLSLIKSCGDAEGISLQELKQGLNGMSMPAIWQTVVFLTEARFIFATVDMEHYRSIDTTNEMLTPASSNCNARHTAMQDALCNQQIECSF